MLLLLLSSSISQAQEKLQPVLQPLRLQSIHLKENVLLSKCLVIFSGLDGPLTALQDTYVVTVVLKSFMMDVLNASPLQVPVFKRSAVGPAFWGVRSLSACDGLDYANILNSQQAGRSITLDQPKLDDFACGSCGCGAFFRAARLECQRFSHACSSAHNIQ